MGSLILLSPIMLNVTALRGICRNLEAVLLDRLSKDWRLLNQRYMLMRMSELLRERSLRPTTINSSDQLFNYMRPQSISNVEVEIRETHTTEQILSIVWLLQHVRLSCLRIALRTCRPDNDIPIQRRSEVERPPLFIDLFGAIHSASIRKLEVDIFPETLLYVELFNVDWPLLQCLTLHYRTRFIGGDRVIMDQTKLKDIESDQRTVKRMPVLASLHLGGLDDRIFRLLANELQGTSTLTCVTLSHDVRFEYEACQYILGAIGQHVKKLALTGRQQLANEHIQLAALCPSVEWLHSEHCANLGSLKSSQIARTSPLKILSVGYCGGSTVSELAKMLSIPILPGLIELRTETYREPYQDDRSWLRLIEVCKSRNITLYVNGRHPWLHAEENAVPYVSGSQPWLHNEEMAFY